ncbi:Alanine--tRNA ligase [Trichinella spiralis]|uniref:Alanine--tRNA ligase n=1 Tax=Trichinella spiralis TaxID=6334 RepID=A0ABR3KSZ3_TRISP
MQLRGGAFLKQHCTIFIMGCFEIPRAKCQSMLVVSKKEKNAQLPGTNLTKQEKLEPKRWSEKCCHSSLEIWMTFRGKCGGKKDKLQSIACSRLSSGGLDASRFLAISRQASELRKQQIITGSFLWSTGSLRVQLLQMALKHAKETNSNTA